MSFLTCVTIDLLNLLIHAKLMFYIYHLLSCLFKFTQLFIKYIALHNENI